MRDPEESRVSNRDEPFATLTSYVATYFNPETQPAAVDRLRSAVHRPIEDQHIDTRTFVEELRRVLSGDTELLSENALFDVTHYYDRTDEAFLKRVWGELFPEEPLPTRG